MMVAKFVGVIYSAIVVFGWQGEDERASDGLSSRADVESPLSMSIRHLNISRPKATKPLPSFLLHYPASPDFIVIHAEALEVKDTSNALLIDQASR